MPPVTLRSRRLACENSRWVAHLNHIESEHGVEVEDYLTLTAKGAGADLVAGVTVIPITEDGRIVLQRNYRFTLGEHCWEGVRGFVEGGEEASAAALRELTEETGLRCRRQDLVALGHATPEASTIAGRAALFAAENCHGNGERDRREPGLGASHRLELAEVEAMLARYEIEDATTLVALYRILAIRRP